MSPKLAEDIQSGDRVSIKGMGTGTVKAVYFDGTASVRMDGQPMNTDSEVIVRLEDMKKLSSSSDPSMPEILTPKGEKENDDPTVTELTLSIATIAKLIREAHRRGVRDGNEEFYYQGLVKLVHQLKRAGGYQD